MSPRRLGVLQWVGLLAGAAVWAAQHIVGFGITQAACGAGGTRWGISNDLWQGVLAGCAAALVVGAEAAAIAVFVQTRGADYGDSPPEEAGEAAALPRSRQHFFATASIAANGIFLMIILLDGVGSIAGTACRQA